MFKPDEEDGVRDNAIGAAARIITANAAPASLLPQACAPALVAFVICHHLAAALYNHIFACAFWLVVEPVQASRLCWQLLWSMHARLDPLCTYPFYHADWLTLNLQMVEAVVGSLPLKEDFDEAEAVYGMLCDMAGKLAASPHLLPSLLQVSNAACPLITWVCAQSTCICCSLKDMM